MTPPAAYLLFVRGGRAVAADGGPAGLDWPTMVTIDGRRYVAVPDPPGTMPFWNELLTPAGAVAGFEFACLSDLTLSGSRLTRAAANSTATPFEPAVGFHWQVELAAGPATWECVQGFGSVTLQAADDPADCALWLMNWSGRPPAFPLEEWPT